MWGPSLRMIWRCNALCRLRTCTVLRSHAHTSITHRPSTHTHPFHPRCNSYTHAVWSLLTHPPCRCIELAPDFTKGYSRKGTLQYFMKDYEKALATYEAGMKHEPDNQELKDGLMRCLEAIDRLAHGEGGAGNVTGSDDDLLICLSGGCW